jgi:SAM-dependent methyltransferase
MMRGKIPGVSDALEFDPDLYRGTAGDYDRFRLAYPPAMIEDLLGSVGPSGLGRLLDLACGTGQITFAMANRFAEVWAVDQEPDMIGVVREKAEAAGTPHVRALVSRAEDLDAPEGAFELVAIGNAFHRLGRDAVAQNALRWLEPGRSIALLWASGPWSGDADWQSALAAVRERWQTRVGAQSRVPAGWDRVRLERPDTEVLTAHGFRSVRSRRFPTVHQWTVDTLIGIVYSTSVLPRAVLGDQAPAFEDDLRSALADYAVDGTLEETIDFAYELARRQ